MKTSKFIWNRTRSYLLIALISLLLIVSPSILYSQSGTTLDNATPAPITWTAKWNNGYQIASSDKNFKMKFGGRIMYDFAIFSLDDTLTDAFGELNNGTEFRRIRFFNSGQIYKNVKYKLQLDFAGGSATAKDMWIMITKIPVVGNFKIGHFKEPFRLEALTSSKYITFIERGLPIAMSTERNSGFMIHNSIVDSKLAYQLGVFRGADKFGNDKTANDGIAITGRLSGLAINNKEKNQSLHLGLAYSHRNPDPMEYGIKSRPENHLGHSYINTGTIDMADVISHLGAEVAFVAGPISIQGELVTTSIDTKDSLNNSYSFTGYYAMASYFLTGERRPYKNYGAGFGRVKPKSNFGDGNGGTGAFEVAVRYSALDLIDGKSSDASLIPGGKLSDITLGLNWHLNPATRIMMNYVLASYENVDLSTSGDDVVDVGDESTFQMRFQIDF